MSELDGYPEHAIWSYVGYDARFDRIKFTLVDGGDIADAGKTLICQYYNGSGWETLSVTDGTNDGGTWRKSGEITFARPADWTRYDEAYGLGGDWFWVRMRIARTWPDNPSWTNYVNWAEVDVYADVPTDNGVNLVMAYAPDTWTKTGYPATVSSKYLEFHGESVLEALVILAEQGGTDGSDAVREHFRYDPASPREVDWLGDTVTASGVRAVAPVDAIAAEGKGELVVIQNLTQQIDSAEVVTRIYPRTLDGITLALATVGAPTGYTHSTASNYIQHTAGYNAYGLIERWVEFSELSLQQADSYTTHPTDLANQLHERATEFLRTHGVLNYFYQLSVLQFPALLMAGDTIECVYHEYTDGVHTVNIDTIAAGTPLHILAPTIQITERGIATIGLEVATIDRSPKSDAGVVVDLVRQNRRAGTGAGNYATLAVTGGGQPPTAGPDIRVSGYQVQRAGAGVLLFSGSGALLAEYATITAALAASVTGDITKFHAGTYAESFTVPAGTLLEGMGDGSVITGAVTLKGRLKACRVTRVSDSVDVLAGIVAGTVGDMGIVDDDVIVDVQNSGGPAYAVYMVTGGGITVKEGDLLAEVGTDGYAAYVASGPFRHERGTAKGTTALLPYWKDA
jgi:hypothetical protein